MNRSVARREAVPIPQRFSPRAAFRRSLDASTRADGRIILHKGHFTRGRIIAGLPVALP